MAAVAESSVEVWGRQQVGPRASTTSAGWRRSAPNTGQVATFKRDWGTSVRTGSSLRAQVTVALPVGPYSGPRPVLTLDVVELLDEAHRESLQPWMSLPELHKLLHILARTAVEEIGSVIFAEICEQPTPPMLGPNYEISFGQRKLETLALIPAAVHRPHDALATQGAEINSPEGTDACDLAARDTVIRNGLQKALRSNGYDHIEREIEGLQVPALPTRSA